jgi:hypothetical protein
MHQWVYAIAAVSVSDSHKTFQHNSTSRRLHHNLDCREP